MLCFLVDLGLSLSERRCSIVSFTIFIAYYFFFLFFGSYGTRVTAVLCAACGATRAKSLPCGEFLSFIYACAPIPRVSGSFL